MEEWLKVAIPTVTALVGVLFTQIRADRRADKAEERAERRAKEATAEQHRPLLVEKHAALYAKWYELWNSLSTMRQAESELLDQIKQWGVANRFYLDPTAYAAFQNALNARHMVDVIGPDKATLHLRGEQINMIAHCGTVITGCKPCFANDSVVNSAALTPPPLPSALHDPRLPPMTPPIPQIEPKDPPD